VDKKEITDTVQELKEQKIMLEKCIQPFKKEIDKIETKLRFLSALKQVGDTVSWNELWDHREEDSYRGVIEKIDYDKKEYLIKITYFYSSYGGASGASRVIGTRKTINVFEVK
jgi:hypothetical protein